MNKIFTVLVAVILVIFSVFWQKRDTISGAPPNGLPESSVGNANLSWLKGWTRPDVNAKVAIQVGHWKSDDLPDELRNIRGNTGAQAGGFTELQVNMQISKLIAESLRGKGIDIEILPATVPPNYWADVFLAVHADGSEDTTKSGYKFATSWRDSSKNADKLIGFLKAKYAPATGLDWDDNITRNMRGYYAFAWWRYDHSIHPMTTPVIIETGFLTNPADRRLLTETPEVPANAISEGVVDYLKYAGLLEE